MSIAASPLAGRVIFVEGAPRSGTTLLVSMLAAHPQIAGIVAESHLFDRGVGALFDNHAQQGQFEGFLSNYVSASELTDLSRDLCDGVLATMRDRVKPGAPRIVEKTPLPRDGARALMQRKLAVFPDATYVHVVREREAVVRSLLRAPWADCDEAGAAEWWGEAVAAIRETVAAGRASYIELSYEQLAAEPVEAVATVISELGLELDDEVRARFEAASRERISSFDRPRASSSPAAAPAAGPGGVPRPAPALRGRLTAGARELARRWRARRDGDAQLAQSLLVAARRGDREQVARLTHRSFHLELRSGAGDLIADGEQARDALVALATAIFRLQAVSEGWGGIAAEQTTTTSLAIVYGDGRRTDLALSALVGDGLVERMQIIAAGDPGGRQPTELVLPEPGP